MHRTLVAAALVAAMCSTASANLFANPGFEDPITSDGPPFVGSWEAFSGDGNNDTGVDVARVSTAMPRTGAQSLELAIDATLNTFAGVFQDVPNLAAGDDVTYAGWHKLTGDAGGIELRIEWRDSINDVEISRTPNFAPTPGSSYEMFELTGTVPAGADTARVVYAIQSFGGAATQQVFIDDVSFIPEPASLSLLALSALLLRRR